MDSQLQQKERKLVPRFRRRNANKNLIDADDEEAQALIEKDLQSHFLWTSDTIEDFKYQFDNYQDQQYNYQHISIDDQANKDLIYDIDNNNQQLWNIHTDQNDQQLIQWTHDQQQNQYSFSLHNNQNQQQQWTLIDKNQQSIQLNITHQDDQLYKHDVDTINNDGQQTFVGGDEFLNSVNLCLILNFNFVKIIF
jgi:hypothetical protein